MTSRSVQRARKPNYTKEETEMLLNQLILYGHFLFNKNQPVNNQQKADVWANIATQVNAVPNSAGRTVDELKHRWQDMAQRARHVLRKNPSTLDLSSKASWKPVPFLHKILKILGESQNKDFACGQQEESAGHINSFDAIYSSDSSCAANIKEESHGIDKNDANLSFSGVSQSNGPMRSNGVKRPYSKISNANDEIDDDNNQSYDNLKNDSHISGETQNHDHPPSGKNFGDEGNVEDYRQRFESRRQRMKKSYHPRKTVSAPSNSTENYHLNYNGNDDGDNDDHNKLFSVKHKHIETFRSMVLDPDSEIVMEMEGPVGSDGNRGSCGSSLSTSNLSTAQDDNFDVNRTQSKNKGVRQRLKRNEKMYQGENKDCHEVYRNHSKHPSGLPLFMASTNFYQKNVQQQQNLETLSKSDLERRCIISQIQMQEQHTRYLILKERKVQLEIELLKGKCVGQSSPTVKTRTTVMTPSQELSRPSSPSCSSCDSNNQSTNTFPEAPAISSVASFKTKRHSSNENEECEKNSCEIENENLKQQLLDDDSMKVSNYDSNCDDDNENSNIDSNDEDENNHCDNNDENIDDENNEDENNEDDLIVSFGDGNENDSDNEKDGDKSANSNDAEGADIPTSQSMTTQNWEQSLQENIGL